MTALLMGSAAGRENLTQGFAEIATRIAALAVGKPFRVVAGMTGTPDGGDEATALAGLIGAPFGLAAADVALSGDVEIAYLDAFAPGEGHLVYAGTGSVAAHIDAERVCHRVGGHGGILDDAGSGFWIGARALRHLWRMEDEHVGSAAGSPLGREIFARVGGSDWNASREFVYAGGFEANRGKVGRLALAVAAAADADSAARSILEDAGKELARLAGILIGRFGLLPVALAGRVFELHPILERVVETALPAGARALRHTGEAHSAAARIAARGT
jgi:N-acetylglucosamine kinase-like BadF-type ATPase